MKRNKNKFKILFVAGCSLFFPACEDFLDKQPEVNPVPDNYFTEAAHLQAYVDGLYDILPSHGDHAGDGRVSGWDYGMFAADNHTDNQASRSAHSRYLTSLWQVSQSGGDWGFREIININLFFEEVLPKYEAGVITGADERIRHYIGEAHFLRAYEYFKKYQKFGDFPIITKSLPDDKEILTEHSRRYPRNEVARFILDELDTAIEYMSGTNLGTTRISEDVATLLKSRVALYEATWLKYFKGTPFVPQGEGWPGKTKSFTADYVYPTGSIDNEINYFLDIAMEASKEVADKHISRLTENTLTIQQSTTDKGNPFMDMFADTDMSGYPEVLMWRQYGKGYVTHGVVYNAQRSNSGVGVTKGMVDAFLMEDGLPIYASSNYQGDDIIPVSSDVFHFKNRIGRDSRLSLFLKEPGQLNMLYEDASGGGAVPVEPIPDLASATGYFTGYTLRKGNSYYQEQTNNGGSFTGCVVFRAAEALLNYMEASYERKGQIDSDAARYWTALRNRAGVDPDYNKTISATDMNKEKEGDWGAYSAGQVIDRTLYNIRRERRCELMAEGLRYMDLTRWRAMDQMITERYHVKGFKAWNSGLVENGYYNFSYGTARANMSNPSFGDYFYVYKKQDSDDAFDGYTWHMAHYLDPIALNELMYTSPDGEYENSVIYQNPYWPNQASASAEK